MAFDWGTLVGAGFGGAALYSVAQIGVALIKRRSINADAAAKLSQSANEIIKSVRDDAERSIEAAYDRVEAAQKDLAQGRDEARREVVQARQEATEARREASAAQREATEARRAADEALYLVRRLTTAILSPYATLEGLREMAGSVNGSRLMKPSE